MTYSLASRTKASDIMVAQDTLLMIAACEWTVYAHDPTRCLLDIWLGDVPVCPLGIGGMASCLGHTIESV